MPEVWIPSSLQDLTGGERKVTAEGATIRQVINNLEEAYPGLKERLVEGNRIRPNFSVFIDGDVSSSGLLESVEDNSEIHFLPAISGGA